MNTNKISTKTIARIAAIQTLYQYKLENSEQNIDCIIQKMINFYQDERVKNDATTALDKLIKIKLSISHFKALVKSTIENLSTIDEIITHHLTNEWPITRLPILLLALLRVAICEIQFFSNIPNKVVISEFTDIASEMLGEHEVGFVNSILDTICKKGEKTLCYPDH